MHHYLLNFLNSFRKQNPDKALPAVYAVVFYNGERSPYPYSFALQNCFDDPLGIMEEVLYYDLHLIDVNQLTDKELKQQEWAGPLALAMKHIRKKDLTDTALEILAAIPWPMNRCEEQELLKSLLDYLFSTGNIDDTKNFFFAINQAQIPTRLMSELMNFEEAVKAMVVEECMEKGMQRAKRETALKLLAEGSEIAFVHKITALPINEIEELKHQPSAKPEN